MNISHSILALVLMLSLPGCTTPESPSMSTEARSVRESFGEERQLTRAEHGHLLTNTGVWSSDGEWIVYDVRSDAAGDLFDGERIEMIHIRSGEVRVLYTAKNGARCGVATFHPRETKVAFILGPENPTPDWQYGPTHRQGVTVDCTTPGISRNLDARNLTPPFTPGALRGGSHVHVWDAAGDWVSFTYEDHVLAQFATSATDHDINQRNIGISVPGKPVVVPRTHPRNHDGDYFTVLATRTVAQPKPGSDEVTKAFEEGWIGANGYVRVDGSRQRRALAFQGHVVTSRGETISEVFVVDLPDNPTQAGSGPLEGTNRRRPAPPHGAIQRRLTFTADKKFPGIQGKRHWLRASPDGSAIACLMRDDSGISQLWTVSPATGQLRQLTRNAWDIGSTFTWSTDGKAIAHAMDNSVCVTDASSGITTRITPRSADDTAPRPEACVFSPDGKSIAYVRRVRSSGATFNQIFVAPLPQAK